MDLMQTSATGNYFHSYHKLYSDYFPWLTDYFQNKLDEPDELLDEPTFTLIWT